MKKVGKQSDNVKENSSTVPSDSRDHKKDESVENQIWFHEYFFKTTEDKGCKSNNVFTLVPT